MKRIAGRNLDIEVFLGDDGSLIARGRLKDMRNVSFRAFKGGVSSPGCFHDLKAELTLSLPDLIISGVNVSFDTVPEAECASVASLYEGLVGIRVASGYTKALLERVGGVRGCAHLTHLLIVMGPAIVQGAFTALEAVDGSGKSIMETGVSGEQVESYFYNSCHVWKQDM